MCTVPGPPFEWYKANKLICCLCVSSCLPPSLSPRVALVIRDDRGGADAPALGAVPAVTLMVTVTIAVEATIGPANTTPTHFGYFGDSTQPRSVYVASPPLINISSLFTPSQRQLHIRLSWQKRVRFSDFFSDFPPVFNSDLDLIADQRSGGLVDHLYCKYNWPDPNSIVAGLRLLWRKDTPGMNLIQIYYLWSVVALRWIIPCWSFTAPSSYI